MKLNTLIIIAITVCVVTAARPQDTRETDLVRFTDAGVAHVIAAYGDLTKEQIFVSSDVKRVRNTVTLRIGPEVPRGEIPKLLTKALLDQAGIVVTKLDDKRTSVTYNDSLPLTRAEKK